jgi:hypothetical protein
MKKNDNHAKESLVNIIILVLVGIILTILYVRFSKRERNSFECRSLEKIYVFDRNGIERRFVELSDFRNDSYVLFLEISNCPSCISKGFSELRSLLKEGKTAFVIVIHDWLEEWNSWTAAYDDLPIFMMKRATYHDYIFSPYLPVVAKFKKGRLLNHRYIY